MSSEGAFSYLTRDYNMKEAYLWPINADQQGTPQQVRKVIDAVRANKITVVFSESTISPDPAKQVARETGAKYGGVLYVDSLSAADVDGDGDNDVITALNGQPVRDMNTLRNRVADAEDVLQTVFLRLVRGQDDYDWSRNPEAYLSRAAINASLDLLRSRTRSKAVALHSTRTSRSSNGGRAGAFAARQ